MYFSALAVTALAAAVNGHAIEPRCDHKSCSSTTSVSVTTPAPMTTPVTTAASWTTSAMQYTYSSWTDDFQPTVWVTHTVSEYITYCPDSTTIVPPKGNKTYTITEAQWYTITDCPESCTISHPPGVTPTWVPGSKNLTSTLAPMTSNHGGQYPVPTCQATGCKTYTASSFPTATSAWTVPPNPSATQYYEGSAVRYTNNGVAAAILAAAFFALY